MKSVTPPLACVSVPVSPTVPVVPYRCVASPSHRSRLPHPWVLHGPGSPGECAVRRGAAVVGQALHQRPCLLRVPGSPDTVQPWEKSELNLNENHSWRPVVRLSTLGGLWFVSILCPVSSGLVKCVKALSLSPSSQTISTILQEMSVLSFSPSVYSQYHFPGENGYISP